MVLALGACKTFDVNVAADKPIQVNLNMDVHVYQHGGEAGSEAAKEERTSVKEAMTSRRNRMEEIRTLKNNRLVGEAHDGTLSIRSLPAGEYGQYVKKTVDAENADRDVLMKQEAREKGSDLSEVRRDQWRHWQRKSFPGEWIEVEDDKEPGLYRWVQKKGAGSGEDDPAESAPAQADPKPAAAGPDGEGDGSKPAAKPEN